MNFAKLFKQLRKLPPAVAFSLSSHCPVNCWYCPQHVRPDRKAKRHMTVEEFKAILSKIPAHVDVMLSGFSEPTVNPHFWEIVTAYVDERGPLFQLGTTLHGIDDLPAPPSGLPTNPFGFVVVHQEPKCSDAEIRRRVEVFKQMLPGQKRIEIMWIKTPNSRGHDVKGIESKRYPGRRRCGQSMDYRWNVVNPGGSVTMCCQDFAERYPIGNLLTGDYKSLGHPVNAPICKTCAWSVPEWAPDWLGRVIYWMRTKTSGETAPRGYREESQGGR